jgi:hypothetical protein
MNALVIAAGDAAMPNPPTSEQVAKLAAELTVDAHFKEVAKLADQLAAAKLEAARFEAARFEAARFEIAKLATELEGSRFEVAKLAAEFEAAKVKAAKLAAQHDVKKGLQGLNVNRTTVADDGSHEEEG